MTIEVRPARTCDVAVIRRLVDEYAPQGILLNKPTVTLYEDVQEFLVAEQSDGSVVGCGAWLQLGGPSLFQYGLSCQRSADAAGASASDALTAVKK